MMENKNMFETTNQNQKSICQVAAQWTSLISIVSMASVDSTWKLNSV